MARRGANYTPLGKKIHTLAKNQAELSEILGLTQQSISGKLNGKIAITLDDLSKLSEYYKVHPMYFADGVNLSPEAANAWAKILDGNLELQAVMEIASTFSKPFAVQLLETTRALRSTASYYEMERTRNNEEKKSLQEV